MKHPLLYNFFMLNTILYYVAENFAILFVLAGFAFFLITQRETPAMFEKKYYWMMLACSVVLLIAVPLEQWTADDIKYRHLRIFLSVIAYWTRPGALMFLLFSCTEKNKTRILYAIPEIINILIMGMAFFGNFPFGYDKETYAFIRHPMGYTSHVVGFIYIVLLLVILTKKVKQGHKIESGILFICVIGSIIAVFYSMVSAYELVSFSIAIGGFFHYLFMRSQRTYDVLNSQIDELNRARLEADRANQTKSRFFFNMSHDIRTPMNAIVGFSEIASRNTDDPQKVKEYLEKIQGSSTYLLNLINEMLEMAKIESGTLKLNEEAHNFHNIINSIQAMFDSQFSDKNIEFKIVTNIKNRMVYCDSTKVLEVFINILSNSLKYTPEGGKVTMEIEETSDDFSQENNKTTYKISITDTGIGISPNYLPHIFDEFSRDDNNTEKHIVGTGLGMPIVKKLVDMMGGEINIASRLNHGTTVSILLNHTIVDYECIPTKIDIEEQNIQKTINVSILLAEDNEFNAEIAVTLLTDEGYKVNRVSDGRQCLEELLGNINKYDIVLMDIQMPNLNGYEATELIRSNPDSRVANIPIIAMTANAFDEDRQMALKLGMNDHIAKPFNMNSLSQKIQRICKQ